MLVSVQSKGDLGEILSIRRAVKTHLKGKLEHYSGKSVGRVGRTAARWERPRAENDEALHRLKGVGD
jgi:hypothetical protein